MKLSEEVIDDVRIKYKSQAGKSDRKHLLVIFSGFREHGTFDFGGKALSVLNCDVIWIDDTFDGHYSYYMLAKHGRAISNSINAFIERKLAELGIQKEACTLAGFSKGGSAALYYMSKFGYKNVVSTVPQFNISGYVKSNWKNEVIPMFGSSSGPLIKEYENVIAQSIENDLDTNKNIYLVTSPADEQYETEIQPNLHLLEKYDNFNLITSKTPLVTKHDEVTRYNVAPIIAIFNLLTEGFAPALGNVANGSCMDKDENISAMTSNGPRAVSSIDFAYVDNNQLFIEGFAFFKHVPVTSYKSIRTWLLLVRDNETIRIRLGQKENKALNAKLYDRKFVDYSFAQFATMKHQGIDITELPSGRYEVMIELAVDEYEAPEILPATPSRKILSNDLSGDSLTQIKSGGKGLVLTKSPGMPQTQIDSYFELSKLEVADNKLFTQGYFTPRDFDIDQWGSINYFARFTEQESLQSSVIPLANAHRDDTSRRSGDSLRDQSKAYFATKGYKGLDITGLRNGTYHIDIIGIFNDHYIVKRVEQMLEVGFEFSAERRSVAVVGSCVSRDLFNSKLNSDWKKHASLVGSFYQMSIMSLMAPKAEIDINIFSDLNPHDFNATKADFDKSFLEVIEREQPQVIVVDLFADARFDLIRVGNSIITDNSWKIGKSDSYEIFDDLDRISPDIDETFYYSLFKSSILEFQAFIHARSPQTRVVLNSCRNARFWRSVDSFGYFNQDSIDKQNKRWDRLEEIFEQIVGPEKITSGMKILLGDPNHPWGRGPVHFTSGFYRGTSDALYRLLYQNETASREFKLVL